MNSPALWLLTADVALLAHIFVVCFVVVGLVLILTGKLRRWSWVKNPWFRAAHLATIAVIVLQSWFGVVCPLTTLEMWCRARAGEAVYAGTFISHWMQQLLYYEAPPWVFAVCYTLFGLLVVASWFWVRPDPLMARR